MENIENIWDSQVSDSDFFSEVNKEDVPQEKVVEKELEDTVKKEELEDAVEEEESFFKETEKTEENVATTEENVVEGDMTNVVTYLKENGLIDYDLEDGVELDSELAEEIYSDHLEDIAENKMKSLMENLPEENKELLAFALKGGDVREFFSGGTGQSLKEGLDLSEEKTQERVLKVMLKEAGKSDSYIESNIAFLKDSGNLEDSAVSEYKRWEKEEAQRKEALKNKRDAAIREEREYIRNAKLNTQRFFDKNESVGVLKFTRKDKKELPSYINDRNVKLENGTSISQLQKDLFYDLPKNQEAYMQLASLMKNRNEDGTFNFKKLAESIKTGVVDKIEKDVRRVKPSIKKEKTILDYFN